MCAERRLVNFPPAVYKVGRKHGVEIGIGKMDLRKNTFRKATVAGILLCFLSTLITGCMISKQEAKEQKKWVEQMNEAFTDDHFKYQGAGFDILGGQAANEARVKSENTRTKKSSCGVRVMISHRITIVSDTKKSLKIISATILPANLYVMIVK